MSAEQGISWATLIALAGVLVNLVFNIVNFFANRTTRRRAVKLSDFNSNVRAPINNALSSLDAIMDGADDIVLSSQSHADKIATTLELSKKFHAVRRILARHLNDCDTSNLVRGNDWARCDEGHMDNATEAFDASSQTQDDIDLRTRLLDVAKSINALRTEIRKKLDDEAKLLMR